MMDVGASDGGPKIWRCSRTTVTFPAEESPTGASPTTGTPTTPKCMDVLPNYQRFTAPNCFRQPIGTRNGLMKTFCLGPCLAVRCAPRAKGANSRFHTDPQIRVNIFIHFIESSNLPERRRASHAWFLRYFGTSPSVLRSPLSAPESVSNKYLNRPTSTTAPEQHHHTVGHGPQLSPCDCEHQMAS